MRLDEDGYLLLQNDVGEPDTRLHVKGDSDTDLFEVKIEDEDYAFLEFASDIESRLAFGDGTITSANIWNRLGASNSGLILNAADSRNVAHVFIESGTGKVGIGDESPDALLDIEADADAINIGLRTGVDLGYVNIQKPAASNNASIQRWVDDQTTVATMNNSDDAYQLSIFGNVVSSLFWVLSDRNLKENIQTLEQGTLAKVMRLNPTRYTFKQNEEYRYLGLPSDQQIGFLAQELSIDFPEAVKHSTEKNGDSNESVTQEIMTVNYMALVPVLTKAIQEQQELIQSQQNKLELQETLLSNLEERILRLEE